MTSGSSFLWRCGVSQNPCWPVARMCTGGVIRGLPSITSASDEQVDSGHWFEHDLFTPAITYMVGVAQLVEHPVVVRDVAGSSPVAHPTCLIGC